MMQNFSDEQIVEEVFKDKEIFSELIKRYQQKIFSYIYRLLNGNGEDARDLTQEVFIKAYINLKSFDPKRRFSPWLYRIAHNEAVNFCKKHYKIKKESIDDLNNPIGRTLKTKENIAEEFAKEEINALVKKLLNLLKPKYKNVLILYYFEEKSYDEIADILNCPSRTVGTLISRAKKKLSRLLAERGYSQYFSLLIVLLISLWFDLLTIK